MSAIQKIRNKYILGLVFQLSTAQNSIDHLGITLGDATSHSWRCHKLHEDLTRLQKHSKNHLTRNHRNLAAQIMKGKLTGQNLGVVIQNNSPNICD